MEYLASFDENSRTVPGFQSGFLFCKKTKFLYQKC
nr:MAG TPA: hypothetical protein [Caudoviricetes sp.]